MRLDNRLLPARPLHSVPALSKGQGYRASIPAPYPDGLEISPWRNEHEGSSSCILPPLRTSTAIQNRAESSQSLCDTHAISIYQDSVLSFRLHIVMVASIFSVSARNLHFILFNKIIGSWPFAHTAHMESMCSEDTFQLLWTFSRSAIIL